MKEMMSNGVGMYIPREKYSAENILGDTSRGPTWTHAWDPEAAPGGQAPSSFENNPPPTVIYAL
jgi:hypothetical protein